MKLVEILARELKEWPEGRSVISAVVQDPTSIAYVRYCDDEDELEFKRGEWVGVWHDSGLASVRLGLAADHATAIVTRADWEAERARIAKPAKKASADGWIRHRGGKCPVEKGTLVDVRYRNGQVNEHVKALYSRASGGSLNALAWCWDHLGADHDIMAFRIHKPAEQPEPVTLPEGYGEVITSTLESKSGPLDWRDRIHEIDAEVSQRNEAHRKAIEALEEERASFMQRLEDEGLQLFQGKVCGGVQPGEDMSDWRNWKAGDLITCMTDEYCGVYEKGKSYAVKEVKDSGALIFDDCGPGSCCTVGDKHMENFKFHFRPSA